MGVAVNNSVGGISALPKSSFPRRLIQGVFRLFGFQVVRIQKSEIKGAHKYFNTGTLLPMEENTVQLNNSFYSDEEALGEYYGPDRLAFYDDVSRYLQGVGLVLDGKRILDVGCGVGYLLSSLKKWADPAGMAGCDFSEAAVKASRKSFPEHEFFVQDIYEEIPGTYDVVLCTEVLEHLLHPGHGLQNLDRAVNPGGWLVITVPNGRLDTIIEHINFWSPESWRVFVSDELPNREIKVGTFRSGQNNIALIRRNV
jgi:2-polyprenyl-3-methyl-5-hydroxy-6-metoxy-1,4-benzoquinol methylase